MKQVEKYYSLIKNWHSKASEEDYFARFMFEYMAFIAFLTTQWKSEEDIMTLKQNNGRVTDRDYIQALKYDSYLNDFWVDLTLRSTKDKDLVRNLKSLVLFLKQEPLKSDERWWNFDGFDINQKPRIKKRVGVLENVGDFSNLVEFWYAVRNNLFHGGKNPSIERDKELVRLAFLTLHFFVEKVLLELKELRRVYPAIWEDFWHRFKNGEAEINTKSDGRGATGNIYECAFLEEYRYPLLLLDKELSRQEIIDIINRELEMSGEMAEQKWSRLRSAAGTKRKELEDYFGNTIKFLNEAFALNLKIK